jgi:hemerythrin-like domain-containing protein
MEKIDGMMKGLKEGDTVDTLTEELVGYETSMLPHLEQEEVECLPLMRAYFTPAEVGPEIQKIVANGPKVSVILDENPHLIPTIA